MGIASFLLACDFCPLSPSPAKSGISLLPCNVPYCGWKGLVHRAALGLPGLKNPFIEALEDSEGLGPRVCEHLRAWGVPAGPDAAGVLEHWELNSFPQILW